MIFFLSYSFPVVVFLQGLSEGIFGLTEKGVL
jgi:hypothetical protein